MRPNIYSYLNEVIGFCWAAFLAGAIPKIRPINVATPKDITMEPKDMMVGISAKALTP